MKLTAYGMKNSANLLVKSRFFDDAKPIQQRLRKATKLDVVKTEGVKLETLTTNGRLTPR
jgi:hypothetical protein